MIADALRLEIERYAARMPQDSPLYFRAANGTLTAEHLKRYLENVHALILHTPIHLTRARTRALSVDNPALALHFEHKIPEEAGHDRWAERDIRRIDEMMARPVVGKARPSDPLSGASKGMQALIAYIETVIDEEPAHYLAYILFAEYLIVLLGPTWLQLLEARCGIPRSAMTVIGNHAELDREHTDEALDQIDLLVPSVTHLAPMRAVVRRSIQLFEAFCSDLIAEVDRQIDVRTNVHAFPAA